MLFLTEIKNLKVLGLHLGLGFHDKIKFQVKSGGQIEGCTAKFAHLFMLRNFTIAHIVLSGVDYHCSNCGEKGHRRHYCPSLSESERANMSYRCGICGQEGHNRASCPSKEMSKNTKKKHAHQTQKKRDYRCSICKEIGHNARKCPSIEISPKL
jgi:DNA-directed RNA polymerase subunit RPC12/RpoP